MIFPAEKRKFQPFRGQSMATEHTPTIPKLMIANQPPSVSPGAAVDASGAVVAALIAGAPRKAVTMFAAVMTKPALVRMLSNTADCCVRFRWDSR